MEKSGGSHGNAALGGALRESLVLPISFLKHFYIFFLLVLFNFYAFPCLHKHKLV